MKRMVAAAGLMLAACTQQPDAPRSPSSPTAHTGTKTATSATVVLDDHVIPRPGEQKTFRDWIVACDNVRTCTMASLGTGTDFPPITMQISRAAGPAGAIEIALASAQEDGPLPASLAIDGQRFSVADNGLSGARAAQVAQALAAARAIEVLDDKGARLATISPAGASAALRYIDAEQGRADTVTALVARGARPASAVPATAALPRVRALPFTGTTRAPPPALLAEMTRTAKCEPPLPGQAPQAQTLGDGATLVLLPCSSGAYNEIDVLFVIRDGKATPAQVDAPAGFEETGADSQTPVHSIINGSVADGVLTSYAKGRGLGDCGVQQNFEWDGTRLRLVEQRSMGECRGNPRYLTVWRAQVMRG